jgi:chromosome segregation ATPase
MANPLRPLRSRVGNALRNSSALREVRAAAEKRAAALETRVEAADLRIGRYARQTDQLRGLIEAQAKQIAQLRETTKELQKYVQAATKSDRIRELDHNRIMSQVGALEERVGRLEQRLSDTTLVSGDADVGEGRALLEEMRREHEQARARFQTISWYEERLRRVEASLASLYEGDARHRL